MTPDQQTPVILALTAVILALTAVILALTAVILALTAVILALMSLILALTAMILALTEVTISIVFASSLVYVYCFNVITLSFPQESSASRRSPVCLLYRPGHYDILYEL